MDFARGERVYFDFDKGSVLPTDSAEAQADLGSHEPEPQQQDDGSSQAPPRPSMGMDFVGDILERAPSVPQPPSAPTFKARPTGFPAHKKRTNRVSAFKQQRTGKTEVSFTSQEKVAPPQPGPVHNEKKEKAKSEREQIDEENRERLANMTDAEIEQERREIMDALSPSLVQKLLGRSNIDEGSNEVDWDKTPEPTAALAESSQKVDDAAEPSTQEKPRTAKKVAFAEPEHQNTPIDDADSEAVDSAISALPSSSNTQPSTTLPEDIDLPTSMHFPRPPQPPDLDPDSPSFLQDLHQKYFPQLPYDPSSLSWMTPIDPSDKSSPYHPSNLALNANELRFNFKGGLLAPSHAREIPVTVGLHHHAEAPEAAGYTIPELARLARSAVPAQRCIAYQTLGRILYRLGKGEFGHEKDHRRDVDNPVQVVEDPNQAEKKEGNGEEDDIADDMEEASSAMATGLWKCVEEERVIETLTEEAAREKGHLTARTYAQEALWNWRRGGGRKRKAI